MTDRPDPIDADELWASLGALPAHDLPADRAAALRRGALAALSEAREPPRSALASLRRIYLRGLEPAWVAAVAVLQLALAAERILQIKGG